MRLSTALTLATLGVGHAYAQGYGGYGGGGYSGFGSGGNSGSSSGYGPGSSSGGSGFSSSEIPFGGDFNKANTILIAHGVMAALVFVILFPFGAISIRLFNFPGLIWFHAAIQALAYMIFIAAAGLGIYFAKETHQLGKAHPGIGLTLLALIFFQPFLGLIHHRLFKKHQRRTVWSYGHIWLGRIIVTLGIINGGLGLQLANNTRRGEIAYGVVAAIVWLVYVASIFIGEKKRRNSRAAVRHEAEPKRGSSSDEASTHGHRTQYA